MDFSVSFQLRLLLLFYIDREFYVLSKDFIKAEYFNSVFCQWLFKFLEIYIELYKAQPTTVVVEEELRSNKDFIELPEEQGLVEEFLSLLKTSNRAELQYVKDAFIKFAKSKAIKSVLSEQSELVDTGNFDDLFTSLKTESRKFDVTSQDRDKELFSLRNLREIYEDQGGIKSGISLIDNTPSLGGLGIKQLSVGLGDLNVGKSLYLTHIGGNAVRQLKHVVHVTLEMSFARTLARYLANLADEEDDITYNEIINFDPQDKVLAYVHDELRSRYEGYLEIIEFPTGKCSVADLYNLLDKYPDTELLIVDYLGLLKPPTRRKEMRFELNELAIALRGIATEAKIHVATVTQAAKTANNKRIIDVGKTAEDYSIMRIADFAVGMGQNTDDAAKKELILFLARSRNSEKFLVERYVTDFKRMRFVLLRQEMLDGYK